ncbi:MAG: ATP-binding protein [Ruminococcus sp.]|nr:ATP-binding protein [Ruminococcus sp.]
MDVRSALENAVEMSVFAFTGGMVVHCFFDDRVKVTLKKVGLVFVLFIVLSLVDDLMAKILGFEFLMMPGIFFVPPVVMQFGAKQGLAGFFKGLLNYLLIDLLLIVYYYEMVALSAYVLDIKNAEDTDVFYYVLITLIFLMGAVLWFIMVRRGTTMPFRRSDKLLTVLLFFITMLNMSTIVDPEENNVELLDKQTVSVMMLLLLLVMPVMIFKNRQSAYFSEKSAYNESYLEAELAASRHYRESQEETRAFRHDMRNNLNLLASLMKEHDYEAAEQYIADLAGGLAELSPRIVTGDDMLDSLISSKLADFDRQGIELTVKGVIEGGLDWKPIDICAVFANAIDNAAAACKEVPEGMDKYIRLSFRKTELQRVMTITNSTAGKVDCAKLMSGEGRYTTKKDKSQHGFGLRNIRRTVERYGGVMQISSEENEFRMTIVLTQ